jgi:hypothetical protein
MASALALSDANNSAAIAAASAWPIVVVPATVLGAAGLNPQPRAMSLPRAFLASARIGYAAGIGQGVGLVGAELEAFAILLAACCAKIQQGALSAVVPSPSSRKALAARTPPTVTDLLSIATPTMLAIRAPGDYQATSYATVASAFASAVGQEALNILSAPMAAPPSGETAVTAYDPTSPPAGVIAIKPDILPAVIAALGAWPTVVLCLGSLGIIGATVSTVVYFDKASTFKLAAMDASLKAIASGSDVAAVESLYASAVGNPVPPTLADRVKNGAIDGAIVLGVGAAGIYGAKKAGLFKSA